MRKLYLKFLDKGLTHVKHHVREGYSKFKIFEEKKPRDLRPWSFRTQEKEATNSISLLIKIMSTFSMRLTAAFRLSLSFQMEIVQIKWMSFSGWCHRPILCKPANQCNVEKFYFIIYKVRALYSIFLFFHEIISHFLSGFLILKYI